jgi:3-oxoadipate enol-lactonase/4-carboxymuconolactone decarboxylase
VAAASHDVRRELAEITHPTLVLAGSADPLLSPVQACEIATTIPGARLAVIAGAGHDLTLEAPAETAERVLAFLDERQTEVLAPVVDVQR